MRKICVVITARTSYTKIRPVLKAIQEHPELELQVICAGSALLNRYGDIDHIIEKDGFPVSERIYMVVEGETLMTSAKTTGLGMIEFASAYKKLDPDVVFIMADRYEQMAAAIPAAYMNIPIAHAQGGEVTGNIDEKVRHAITKLADIHFPATQRAAEWLVRMGENTEKVIFSGCPSTDLCQSVLDKPELDFDLYQKYGGVGGNPDFSGQFLIVMQHPVTTEYGSAKEQAEETLQAIVEIDLPTFWFWPNLDAGSDQTSKAIRTFRENNKQNQLHFFRNMEPLDFLRLLNKASVIIGNSSCAIREASFLGTAAVNIGTRQANREQGPNAMNSGYNYKEIANAIRTQLAKGKLPSTHLYGDGKAAKKIADSLASFDLSSYKILNYLDDFQQTDQKRMIHS